VITLVEVGPRDGLQSEPKVLSLHERAEYITRAINAGLRRIEAVSFVNPKRVPQMADAEGLMALLPRREGVSYSGLALNERGAERAVAAGVDEVNYVVISTDTYNRANQGCATEETLAQWDRVAEICAKAGIPTTVTIAASFGCPFEGEVSERRVAELAVAISRNHPKEIALADSIGVATPVDITRVVSAVRAVLPDTALRCHFHNTRNTGLANVMAAIQAGVSVFDSSIGGIGGCPFAPGATGNIATEDLVYMLKRMGEAGTIDLRAVCETAVWLSQVLEHPLPGSVSRTGIFPFAPKTPEASHAG
jgi:hydroxymethylglutaryl-CoA lyase